MKTITKVATILILGTGNIFAAQNEGVRLFFDSKTRITYLELFRDQDEIPQPVPVARQSRRSEALAQQITVLPVVTVLVEIRLPVDVKAEKALPQALQALASSYGVSWDPGYKPQQVQMFNILPYPSTAETAVYRVRGAVPFEQIEGLKKDAVVRQVQLVQK